MPFAKAGDMMEMWSDGTMAFVGEPNLPRFNKKDVRMFPLWFEEVKEPELPKEFFCIDIDKVIGYGYSYFSMNENTIREYIRFIEKYKSVGNYFETKEEAEKYLEYLKSKAIIKQDTKGFTPDWHNVYELKFYGYYDTEDDALSEAWVHTVKRSIIYFKSVEDIKESFEAHPEEWKTYLTYE